MKKTEVEAKKLSRNAARTKYQSRKKELIDNANKEERTLSEDEDKELDNLSEELRKADEEYEEARDVYHESLIKKVTGDESKPKRAMLVNILHKAITGERDFTEGEQELIQEGREAFKVAGQKAPAGSVVIPMESRKISVGSDGANFIKEDKFDMIGPLRSQLGISKAGATILTGLTNNFSIPGLNAIQAYWAGEGEKATEGDNGTFKLDWSPKRITAKAILSRLSIIQDDVNAEQTIHRDIVNAVMEVLDKAIFGEHATVATKPDGFFTGTDTVDLAIKGTASNDKLIDMEAVVGDANAPMGKASYVTTAKGVAALKKAKLDAGSGLPVLQNGEANGYPVHKTNNVSKTLGASNNEHGLVFSSAWEEYFLGQWGGMAINIDTNTLADQDEVVLTINTYWDGKPRRPEAFAIASIAV